MAHRSVSQLNTYQRCPRQYYYRYMKKLPEKPSEFLMVGTAFDDAMNFVVDNGGCVPNKQSRPHDDVVDAAILLMSNRLEKLLSESPFDDEIKENARENVFQLSKLVRPYFMEFLPDTGLVPHSSQYKLNYYIDGIPDPILGYIDMIAVDEKTGRFVIVDFKASNSVALSLDYRRQVWVYAKALEDLENLDYLPDCQVHMFSKKVPTIPKAQRTKLGLDGTLAHHWPEEIIEELYTDDFIEKKVSLFSAEMRDEDWLTINESYVDLEHSIRTGFFPKNRTHTLCTKRFCSFWETCMSKEASQKSLDYRKSVLATGDGPVKQEEPVLFMVEDSNPPPLHRSPETSVFDFLS